MRKKRAVSDEPIQINADHPTLTKQFFEQLHLQIISRHYDYKVIKELKQRDTALCCLLVLAGIRAKETALKRKQFIDLDDRILLMNVKTVKRGDMRKQIDFPKEHPMLREFTLSFKTWLDMIPDKEAYVFPHASSFGVSWHKPLSRYRIERIVRLKTGKFPHWLRGVHETFYGEIVFKGNAWKLKKHMGLRRLESTVPYVEAPYRESVEQELYGR